MPVNSLDVIDRWEYRSAVYDLTGYDRRPPHDFDSTLGQLGLEGWELVSANLYEREYDAKLLCIFKRRRVG